MKPLGNAKVRGGGAGNRERQGFNGPFFFGHGYVPKVEKK